MFEKASRLRLRFDTPKGQMSTEDLWRLPMKSSGHNQVSLDDIAKDLHQRIKNQDDISFVDDVKQVDEETQLKFDIVRHIIKVRKLEAQMAVEEHKKSEIRQRILAIKAKRQNEALEGKTDEELDALLASM